MFMSAPSLHMTSTEVANYRVSLPYIYNMKYVFLENTASVSIETKFVDIVVFNPTALLLVIIYHIQARTRSYLLITHRAHLMAVRSIMEGLF
ncbi:hypothetical protein PRIPAC_80509 [Pristionchus pacificus]|uniref:Uncharacterized protein n=1 Tax=Pristionchus pacificus TaxID=54126 RepID=A0A2A6BY33_PRIPA|nr:hypothetical protein PRIPAC_80509 [Pristionchus pacificus]|eukprot:PDM70820.1 hypothetical protein PRIPAC_45024 [Pristionchus pacificus]